MTRQSLIANGIMQSYLRFGSPQLPTLVLLPGITRPAQTWASVGERLGARYDTISVEGHTDRMGSTTANQRLSEQRAAAVLGEVRLARQRGLLRRHARCLRRRRMDVRRVAVRRPGHHGHDRLPGDRGR